MDDDAIAAAVENRRKLAAYSRDTGIPKHGDLTQMDRQIAGMMEAQHVEHVQRQNKERGRGR